MRHLQDPFQQRPDPLEAISERINDLLAWLEETAPECFEAQKHLDASRSERVFWHHGYLLVLMDVRDLMSGRTGRANKPD
jgi:hypothetical protein